MRAATTWTKSKKKESSMMMVGNNHQFFQIKWLESICTENSIPNKKIELIFNKKWTLFHHLKFARKAFVCGNGRSVLVFDILDSTWNNHFMNTFVNQSTKEQIPRTIMSGFRNPMSCVIRQIKDIKTTSRGKKASNRRVANWIMHVCCMVFPSYLINLINRKCWYFFLYKNKHN